MLTDPVAKYGMLHAVAAAALSGADGAVLTRMSALAAREWGRANSTLQNETLMTLSACLWWGTSALSTSPGEALTRPQMPELMAEVDKLSPLTSDANRVLGALAGAEDLAAAFRLMGGLGRAGGMDIPRLVAGMFEATVATVRQVTAKHGDESAGRLCIDLGQMTVFVGKFLGPAA
ncbi:hypothetical protein [Streptomyces sp. NPDC101455]|uniref:hypothetical protein n=1 Tax=Streptomyces sp. NPDC101455 TaxID=3366142 RepID=UPI0038190472